MNITNKHGKVIVVIESAYFDLNGADLHNTSLRGADLRKANLRGAGLREARLREADLREAILRWLSRS